MKFYLRKIYRNTKKKYFDILRNDLKDGKRKIIVTANPETIMNADKDDDLSNLLLDRRVSVVPDGIAVVKACRSINHNVIERITGIDISQELLRLLNEQKKKLFLFGAKEEVVVALIDKIKTDYKNIKVVGYSNGYVEDKDEVFKQILKLKPDVCLIALGIPEQEKIIYKHIDKIKKGIFIGVGGSFDVLSGYKKRAPEVFIKLNLEWLYRIIKEPKRIKRFWDNNVKFMFKIYWE